MAMPDGQGQGRQQGRVLGSYRLAERVGKGGMGEVYRAEHLQLGREAAVKVLPADLASESDFLLRFKREASSAASLDHPNILPVWDYGEQEGPPFLVMPYVRGGTLKERMQAGPVPAGELLKYLDQIAEAIDYAHSRGIIHRDVKPANILLADRGRVYLSDFGIARALEGSEGLTRTGMGVGTPEYMAPEQAQGRADTRSDLYALGIMLYQMLTGQVPFTGNSTVEVLMKHLQEPVPLAPLRSVTPPIPAVFGPILQRALAKNPNDRFQTGQDLATAIRGAVAQTGFANRGGTIAGAETIVVGTIGGYSGDIATSGGGNVGGGNYGGMANTGTGGMSPDTRRLLLIAAAVIVGVCIFCCIGYVFLSLISGDTSSY